MKYLKRLKISFVMMLLCILFSPNWNMQASFQSEAKQLWERAIAAKGGRERLHAIRNIAISSSGSYKPLRFRIKPGESITSRSLKRSGIVREELYVLPSKFWAWNDLRPAVFGLRVTMYNYETKMKYVISEGEPNRPPEAIEDNELSSELQRTLAPVQILYLMESRWIRPEPVNVNTVRIGSREFDVLQTEVAGERVDFTINRKTHLPVRITFYNQLEGKVYTNVLKLSNYIDVDGIRVPLTIEMDDGHEERSIVKFNVEYNDDIFLKSPPIEAGPEAWKK
ncbi:MAG TPA: hypothetical protein VMM84_06360 [Pyrinomonadaceae bacterium]|nr:hypothetical protein [Pyrinomonadaceae bacterium]